ncbi:hypothetical protein QBC35DRAFT_454323 [Podospora australis]|uniref:NACHT domain-containing protein n=1 Tax=Podospora australis TaxID=1536484 RepID=A0AAN7AFJ5_9PEZI|nr:hypothetical protein QBC35DRAFT_454323 [Podospora australis]
MELLVETIGDAQGFVIVDALNEVEQSGQLLESLIGLAERLPSIRMIVSSTSPLTTLLHRSDLNVCYREVEMKSELVNKDIASFVDDKLHDMSHFPRLNPAIKHEIRTALISKAGSILIYRFHYAQYLLDQLSSHRILSNLSLVPGSEDYTLLYKVLLWLWFGVRPLTLLELSEAVVIDETSQEMTQLDDDSRLFDPHCLVDLAQGMIRHD